MSPAERNEGPRESAALGDIDEFLDAPATALPGAEAPEPAGPRPDGVRDARKWLILGLSFAGLLYVVGASLGNRVVSVPITAQLGLLELLPLPYWVGLVLMGVAMALAVRERSDALVVGTGALFLAVLAGTPNLFEPNPSNWDAYAHFSEAQLILSTGHLPSVNVGQYSANWPGIFVLLAMFYAVAGVPVLAFVGLHPFLAGALTFLGIFTFLRGVFPPPVAAPGSVLSSLFAVWAQYHLSPQSLGFVLALLLLAFMWRGGIRWRAASGLLFAGLVVSHPTSTILVLSILVVMGILSPLWAGGGSPVRVEAAKLRRLTLAYGGVWFGWLYFRATATYSAASTAVLARIGHLLSLPEQTLNVATARTAENLLPVAPALRLGALAVYALVGLVGLPFLLRDKKDRRLGWFLLSSMVAIAGLAGADLLAFGGQFYDRSILMFSVLAPGMCLAGIPRIRIPRVARVPPVVRRGLAVALVIASITAASTVYYLEAFNEVSDRSIAVSNFIEQVPPGSAVLDGRFPPPIWQQPSTWTHFTAASFYTIYPDSPQAYAGVAPTYEVFDNTSELWYEQWFGIGVYHSYQQNETAYARIYDNGEAAVYFVGG